MVLLPDGEVAVAAGNGWALSAIRGEGGDTLVWRRVGDPGAREAPLRLSLATAAIAGDSAYVSGLNVGTATDSGILSLDLASGKLAEVLPGGSLAAPRTLTLSRTGKTLVSSVCVGEEPMCGLDIVSTADGATHHINAVPGYLRTTADGVAVVGPDSATWVAGIDLDTGKELWRHQADEVWLGYATADGKLIQGSLSHRDGGALFVVESIDLVSGRSHNILETPVNGPIGLWPDVSSDESAVVGPGFSVEDALLRTGGKRVLADVYDLSTGARAHTQMPIGGE
jgi:hypothetical protein